MNDGKKRKITAWEYQYDNGEVALLYHDAGIWRGKKINTVQSEYYQNPHKAIARIRELEAKIPGKDNFTFRKRNFEAGIEYLSDRCDMGVPIEQQSKEAQHHACAALLQMLNSCGSDVDGRRTILQVVSASLSGYIFRLCSEWELFTYGEPVPYETAPRIVCSRADGAGNALRQVMASLFLDTEELLTTGAAAGSVESHLPAYLPSVGNERQIIDCAYAQVCKGERDKENNEKYFDEPLAAQYRDTAVGINTAFFRAFDVENFVRRNRWVTIIQLGNKCELEMPIRIEGKILARSWCGDAWDFAAVRLLIDGFLRRIYTCELSETEGEKQEVTNKKERERGLLLEHLKVASQRIDTHNSRRGTEKYRGLQRLWLETQIVVLGELMSYMNMLGFWKADEGQATLNGWLHVLLPDVYPAPVDDLPADDSKHVLNYETDSQNLLEKLVAAMVTPENCKHCMAVPVKGEFPMKKADGTVIWGYVRGFQVTGKDGHRHRVPTLQIREDMLTEIAPMLMPFECDWLAVIKTVRGQQPDYLVGKSKNVRLPVDGESRLCATLVLSVEKLSWLPKGAWNILLELTALIAQKTE